MPKGRNPGKPPVSQAQNRLMQGVAHGSIKPGGQNPPKAVAQEFARGAHGKNVGKLPQHKRAKA